MAMSAQRSSVFTFESTVHSSHVLRLLDEQRCRDTLCDVTVLVEGQSFRAHRSVLASCCEYFSYKISSLTQHGAVITLPQEVTAAGFEPLLKFAYTSKLLFGKDNVIDIRNSASVLGFRDLDEACFDFLLPKFLSSDKDSAALRRETCCETKCGGQLLKEHHGIISDDVSLDEKEEKLVADSSSQQEVAWLCNRSVNSKMGSQNNAGTLTPERANEHFMQCPKYRRQLACEKETCVTDKSLTNPVTASRDDSDLNRSPCSSSANSTNKTEVEFPGNSTLIHTRQSKGGPDNPLKTETADKKTEGGFDGGKVDVVEKETNEMQEKRREMESDVDMKECSGLSDRFNVKTVSSGSSTRSSGLILNHCSLKTFGESSAITGSVGRERFDIDVAEDKKARDSVVPVSIHNKSESLAEAMWKRADEEVDREKGGQTGSMDRVATNNTRERSTMEREVTEHLVKRLGSDVGFSQLSFQDSDAGSSSDTGSGRAQSTSSEWLNYNVNLNSMNASCPYYQDMEQSKCVWKGAELSECEGASQSGVSSLNSGEDGDTETETEGDSESYRRERARQVQLPFSVDWVVDLSRNDFQQLLKQQVFTREQLEFVHDMRRRSKNRLAAQRCRKRKLDCIYNLQCEINKLKTEREKLIMERSQLGQMKLKTCHSVSALCQRVCSEANLQPEQLQVLAKYTSPDCPLSSFFPHIDALLSQPGLSLQPQSLLSASTVCLDEYMASEEASSSSSRDTLSGDGQH